MGLKHKFIWHFIIISVLSLKKIDGDGIRLPDQSSSTSTSSSSSSSSSSSLPLPIFPNQETNINVQQSTLLNSPETNEPRFSKNILDFVGLGTGSNVDPYVARTNTNCISGDLSECFKTHALNTFDEIFVRESYHLTDNVRVIRMPEEHQRSLQQDSYEFSTEPRSTDSEWDQLIKFALRKIERFVKSAALEVRIPEELTEGGRYSARFVDGITDEIDIIEDKKAPIFTRHKLKKLFIPLLLVLKLFKLKLLLFLPFILGLVSLKKFLGLAAIVIPGVFAYFKLCRPQQNFGNYYSPNGFPQYSPQGIGAASFHSHEHFTHSGNPFYRNEPSFAAPYTDYYGSKSANENGIRFGGGGQNNDGQNLAYQGYSEYRSNTKKDAK